MEFPFGKAPLAILLLSLISGAGLLLAQLSETSKPRPDLVMAIFAQEHADSYKDTIARFEKENKVTVQLQVVDQLALKNRLESAMEVGADVPDMVELLEGTLGVFTTGPISDVRFVDLTQRIRETGLYDKVVTSRFSKWSSRDHIFALPHDVHPVMLAYRRDLTEQLGIDVTKLTTWDEFDRVGRDVVARCTDQSGVVSHYMLDMPVDGRDLIRMFMVQRGAHMFNTAGKVVFDTPETADVVDWYVHQVQGKTCISFPAGWGQTLARAITDGVVLFVVCPDWRTKQLEVDIPNVAGKMGLIPLPAWQPGGLRTSTWGGTGLAFPRAGKHFDLAWKLAMQLYYDPTTLGQRFAGNHVLPPLKAAWADPEICAPNDYWGGMKLGSAYAQLAPQIPSEVESCYQDLALDNLCLAFNDAKLYQQSHGDDGLREYTLARLKDCAARVQKIMDRNVFQHDDQTASAAGGGQ
jgi:arabinosaccharide transport system substrate-binding protein